MASKLGGADAPVHLYARDDQSGTYDTFKELVLVPQGRQLDAAAQRSKGVDEIPTDDVDVVVTLCAEEVCPVFLGDAARFHWALPDPAAVQGDEDTRLEAFRRVRDELRRRLDEVFRPA